MHIDLSWTTIIREDDFAYYYFAHPVFMLCLHRFWNGCDTGFVTMEICQKINSFWGLHKTVSCSEGHLVVNFMTM